MTNDRYRYGVARATAVVVLLLVSVVSCADDDAAEPDPSTAPGSTTTGPEDPGTSETTALPVLDLGLASETEVDGAYRQGVARVTDGWLFSTNQGLYVVDEDLARVQANEAPIPADLLADGYDHLGDVDVDLDAGIVYAPLEQGDYDRGEQIIARYDLDSLELIDTTTVAQAHIAWVSISDGVVFSMSGFDDHTVLRYDADTLEPLDPLPLSEELRRVQGGDVYNDNIWFSTDEDEGSGIGDGIFQADLATGTVVHVGALEHSDGEGEGIDVTPTDDGLVHAVSIDAAWNPVWFQHFAPYESAD